MTTVQNNIEESIVMVCGSQPKMSKIVSEQGIPVIQYGAINVYTILPCPLKVRFKKEFETFIEAYNASNEKPIYCPTIMDGSPKGIEEKMNSAENEDDLPEMLITTGLNTIFSKPFKQKYLESGVYVGLTKPSFLDKMPEDYSRIASQYNIGFLAFGAWSLIYDMSLDANKNYPRSWTDLAKPEFKNKLSIHGYQGKASGTSLLLVLKERMGEKAISQFAENIKNIKHFAEVIKGIDSSDETRAEFNILPNAASAQMPTRKNAAMIEFNDGPLMAPPFLFVKKSKLQECQAVIDFFWSDEFREILTKGDFHMPDDMDWSLNYSYPSWDYLATHDFNELAVSLDAEFQKGLNRRN
jgi:ABC-type Fe3+ transport system substrate-binding protein